MNLKSVFLFGFLVGAVKGYSQGAPIVACDSMTPNHGVDSQKEPSPYKVIVDKTSLPVGSPVTIMLTSKSSQDEFKGFLVQLRLVGGNSKKAEGNFVAGSHPMAKPLGCSRVENSAMTHNSAEDKKEVTLTWIPSAPGEYRIHTTFVKSGKIFWVNQIHEEVIQVLGSDNDHSHHGRAQYDWNQLCSNMKLNESLEVTDVSSPYTLLLGPTSKGKDQQQDNHKIEQKSQMWINVSSEYGTPIERLFLQVRKSKTVGKAYGRFQLTPISKSQTKGKLQLIDCFGSKENSVLFVNIDPHGDTISDVNVRWEAPSDEFGDFEVVGSIMNDDTFWDSIVKDHELKRIQVVKKGENSKPNKAPGSSGPRPTAGDSFNNANKSMGKVEIELTLFLIFLFSAFLTF